MADDLESYFLNEHQMDRAAIDEIQRLTDEVLETFGRSFLDGPRTWPYQLINGEMPVAPRQISFSTTAMIAFALGLAIGRIRESALAPSVGDPQGSVPLRTSIATLIDRAMDCAIRQSEQLPQRVSERVASGMPRPKPSRPLTDSATFGWDDPFTVSWLLEVLRDDQNPERAKFRQRLGERGWRLVRRVAEDPAAPVLQIKKGEEVPHAFPLLRVLQLAHTLSRIDRHADPTGRVDLSDVREYLIERVHLHLSESQIVDSGFDAADLVFSLEGWILTSSVEPDLAVVDQVFKVLSERQERTPYWRPLRPFRANQQGLILLPQSVEIANSLLRICNSPALDVREYFSRHVGLLSRYTRWLQGRVYRGRTGLGDAMPFVGWESEHTYTLDRIHLWQTSQVLIFLQHYMAMFQQHLARRLLRLAPLVPDPPPPANPPRQRDPAKAWAEWQRSEPFTRGDTHGSYRVYEKIGSDFLEPRVAGARGGGYFSMMLYGPPGTGKSTIARELGRALGFPLLTVTPSDFLTGGGEGVEARAKAIFQVLAEQRDLVVLFDEIDHLLLDRDSGLYRDQGDVFKLLTPGMLTKLSGLAEQRRVIFVIATNYYERIDPAIKRPGRIDARYLVLPPDLEQRRSYLEKVVDGWSGLNARERRKVAEETVRFTYRELTGLGRQVRKRRADDPMGSLLPACLETIHQVPPMIRLDTYSRRLGLEWGTSGVERRGVDTVERPWEEFSLLTYLELEARRWTLPPQPEWLPDAIKESLEREAVEDPVVAEALRKAVIKARGATFMTQATGPSG
jgi:hypothetical protein